MAVAISLLLVAAMPVHAETFDCHQPTSPLARLICNDATLRAADADENGVYDSATLASLDRPALRDEERVWFAHEILPYNWFAQHNAPIDNAKIIEAYRRRSDALRQETRDWRKLRHSAPGATLTATCLALPQRSGDCTVAAFAPIEGAPLLRYQQQSYALPAAVSAVIIFAAVPDHQDEWLPLAVASSANALTPPQAIASPAGTLLIIAGSDSDASALYRLDKDALQDIDDRSWLETIRSRLPDGLIVSSEIVADYGKMQAVTKVTRSQSTCCPVGSVATIDLTIADDRIAVSGITFGEPKGSPNGNSH
jgi:hypothetical protein